MGWLNDSKTKNSLEYLCSASKSPLFMNNNYEILRTENNHQTFTSQFKKENELRIKTNEKHQFTQPTHIEKKASVEKKSHNFLVQNFQKKKILSFYLLLPILQFLKSPPPNTSSPPLLSGPRLLSHVQKTSQTNTAFYL